MRRSRSATEPRGTMWRGVSYTAMYVSVDTPRAQIPHTLCPWADISGTRTIGYLKCPTREMRSVFGPGQPVRGQWILQFTPPLGEAYIVNIHRSLRRDANRDWDVSAKYWPDEWEHTMEVIEDVSARCQAVVNTKLAAVAGAVFGNSDLNDFRRLCSQLRAETLLS